jgi:competence protein ComEC
VSAVYEPGTAKDTEAFAQYARRTLGRGRLEAGDVLTFDGVRFEVLWPRPGYAADEVNDLGLVIRVSYGATSVLLAADIEAPVQRELMAAGIAPADVLKVPHHGSKTSLPAFLRSMARGAAVISVGADNRFGHPSPESLAALGGVPVLRTDRDGRVTIHSDGERVRITTER